MDPLRIREFFFKSNYEFPNSSVSIKEDSFASINSQSILEEWSEEWFFYHQSRGSGEKSEAFVFCVNTYLYVRLM